MDFMKRHKFKLILLGVFILVFIIALVALIKLLYPDSRKDVYGNRLAGIEKVKISDQIVTEIKDKIGSSDFVNDVDYVLKGKLINFVIDVKDDIKKDDIKKLANNVTDLFESDIQNYYDIQIIVISDKEESKNYPVFAYKHKSKKEFVWTNNM